MTLRYQRWLGGVMWILLLAAVAGAQQPPQSIHVVGDHWTAWDPPAESPEGAEVHIVQPGDTLWGLASQYLGDPYLWPQIWEQNTYILDAHWIYPGDPIVVSLDVSAGEEALLDEVSSAGEEDAGEDEDGRLSISKRSIAPVPLGTEDDIYCSGYIGDLKAEFGYHLTGSEYQALSPSLVEVGGSDGLYGQIETVKYDLSLGDIVYVDGGRAGGLSVGEVLSVIEAGDVVHHPVTGEDFGRMYLIRGRIRVVSIQETTAIGEIVQACEAIRLTSERRPVGLVPFEPQPIPLGRHQGLRPANIPVAAAELEDAPVILMGAGGVISIAKDHVVYIDRGEDSDLVPGDLFTVYRMNREGFPPVVIGRVAVLLVQPHSAVAKVIESRYTLYAGDRLDPR